MPFTWLIAFLTVVAVLKLAATIRASTIKNILQTHTLWPLAIIIPSLVLGKTLGFILANLFAYITPPMRRAFKQECRETGRNNFAKATKTLACFGGVFLFLTTIGLILFLWRSE